MNLTPIAATLQFIEAVLGAPALERPQLGGEWALLHRLCADNELAANDIPDAWLEGDTAFPPAAQRAAYREYFCRRLDAPRSFVEEAVRARSAHV